MDQCLTLLHSGASFAKLRMEGRFGAIKILPILRLSKDPERRSKPFAGPIATPNRNTSDPGDQVRYGGSQSTRLPGTMTTDFPNAQRIADALASLRGLVIETPVHPWRGP